MTHNDLIQNIKSCYNSSRPFVLTSSLQLCPALGLSEADCNTSLDKTADTESETTIKRANPHSPFIASSSPGHRVACIQALNLRNAMRFPAWSAFNCSPEPAERTERGGMPRAGRPAYPARVHTARQRSNLIPGTGLRSNCTRSGRVLFW